MSRVLVAYGSKHGSTVEIAERIGTALRADGHEPDVKEAGAVDDVAAYDAVVLGSAVYQGRWRREAKSLLRRLQKTLDGRPLWLFSSGPVGDTAPDAADRWQHPKRVREMGDRLGARDQTVFGGRAPTEPSGFMERAVVKNVPEDERDRIDPAAIDAWAHAIAADLDEADRGTGER